MQLRIKLRKKMGEKEMKTLMVAALAVAAVGANVAFAEEDDGIVSAAPVVADPDNPQPGMTCFVTREGSVG